MSSRLSRFLLCLSWLVGDQLDAKTTIVWSSDTNQTSLSGIDPLFDSQFKFELGVFDEEFVPTKDNVALWAEHWNTAGPDCRTAYDASPDAKQYASSFTPADNEPPFGISTFAYVWGFRGDALTGEWILFRNNSPTDPWTWPNADTLLPPSYKAWSAKDAKDNVVIGSISSNGNSFMMQSEVVTNAAPPTTTWSQWKTDNLTGETLNGPNDDPDRDGTPNMLEFVFGTPPKSAGAPTATPLAVIDGHLQITIPRRIDHLATLTVEVSDDLTNWQSGMGNEGATTEVSNTPTAWIVRDNTLLGPAHPRRFMRLKAELSAP